MPKLLQLLYRKYHNILIIFSQYYSALTYVLYNANRLQWKTLQLLKFVYRKTLWLCRSNNTVLTSFMKITLEKVSQYLANLQKFSTVNDLLTVYAT